MSGLRTRKSNLSSELLCGKSGTGGVARNSRFISKESITAMIGISLGFGQSSYQMKHAELLIAQLNVLMIAFPLE